MEAATSARPGYELWRPNRESAKAKTTKAAVVFVLLVSAGVITVITLGGWDRLQSGSVGLMTLMWAGLYLLFAFMIARWNRGLLPVSAALAMVLSIFAAVSAPGWFDRAKEGLSSPVLPEELIGALCLILIAVQFLLIGVAMYAFGQNWHVEEERPIAGQGDEPGAARDEEISEA